MELNMTEFAPQAVVEPIGREQIADAYQTLQRYKTGKANYEQKLIGNYEWYKLRNWSQIKKSKVSEVQPNSAWLQNAILNKHADAMDNFPAPRILPREANDQQEAKMLSDIIPCILDNCDFEETYDAAEMYKLIAGSTCYGVFWDASMHNGLGDISVKRIDLLSLYWEPGIMDIQKSENVFSVELHNNTELESQYPQLRGHLTTTTVDVAQYIHDDSINTDDKSVVVDWYYKAYNSNGKQVVHYVKWCNDIVLYATQNDPAKAERGLYDDGKYPFAVDAMLPLWGELGGLGMVDIAKNAQEYIDRLGQAILENTLANARPRVMIRKGSSINREQFLDYTNPVVEITGNMTDDTYRPITVNSLDGNYLNVLQLKIDELKETTGTRDVATGGTTSGVTAASAIAAMQEAGSKLSRDFNKSAYRTFRKVVEMVIERIRQFYDLPRTFRILGPEGAMQFVQYTNAGLQPQNQGMLPDGMGGYIDLGQRVPLFDVEISAEKKSPYARISQNQMALEFYGANFFDPANMIEALATLSMMDFDGKDIVIKQITENGLAYQKMLTEVTKNSPMPGPMDTGDAPQKAPTPKGVSSAEAESTNTSKARQRVAESTAPR